MKTIVIGWESTDGSGKEIVVADSTVKAAKQIEIFENAKRNHVFPEGIKRVSLCVLEEREIAVQIDPKLAVNLANQREAAAKKAAEDFAKREAEKKAAAELSAAQEGVQKAAQHRNKLLAERASQLALKRNADEAGDTEAAKKAQGIINELGPKIDAAKTAFEEAQQVLAHHTSPKKPEPTETKKSETKKEKK